MFGGWWKERQAFLQARADLAMCTSREMGHKLTHLEEALGKLGLHPYGGVEKTLHKESEDPGLSPRSAAYKSHECG